MEYSENSKSPSEGITFHVHENDISVWDACIEGYVESPDFDYR